MTDWKDKFLNKIVCGDCLELLKEIPNDKNIVLITDPPYGINLNLSWLSDMNVADGKKPNKLDALIVNDDKPFDITPFLRFKRRLIFGFPYIYDKEATGWIVWDKQPKIAERGIVTPVELASTTLRKGYDIIRVMWEGFMRDKSLCETREAHPTQKPIKLMYRLIEKFTKKDEIILDCFLGSGTTAVACKMLGRNFIGIEISPEYCKIAEARLKAVPEKLMKFDEVNHAK
jgi:DNA modification methylase